MPITREKGLSIPVIPEVVKMPIILRNKTMLFLAQRVILRFVILRYLIFIHFKGVLHIP